VCWRLPFRSGFFGVALLLAMWIAHFRMFLFSPGLRPWIGISVVGAKNFVGIGVLIPTFFDFTQRLALRPSAWSAIAGGNRAA